MNIAEIAPAFYGREDSFGNLNAKMRDALR
jgi:hypothetical protein